MASSRDRYRMFEMKPALGGQLVTRGSEDNSGIFNYVIKRDFRRDLDVEQRREGHDYFYPNTTLPVSGQTFPSQVQVDSLTFAGGTVTATRIGGQWFEVGESVVIAGAVDPAYNGTHVITAVTPTTFQYAITGTPVSPDPGKAIAQADEEISLITMARRPNGQTAVIAGSKTRLYRYYALEEGDYVSQDPADYPKGTPSDQLSYWSDGISYPADAADYPPGTPTSQQEYVDTNPGYWVVIGSGFSKQGKRWESLSINGYLVLNNGVDLPMTYRVEEMEVVPIYEMREQGIASAGTIWETNGILNAGDLTEIKPEKLPTWFQTAGRVQFDSLTSAAGVATATRAAGHTFKVGDTVTVSGAVNAAYNGDFIVTGITATTLQYAIAGTPPSPDPTSFPYVTATKNEAPYGVYPDEADLERTTYRVGWAVPDEPRRWGALVPGSIDAGSNALRLAYSALSLTPGMSITIPGAGAPHAGGTADNLEAKIINVSGTNVIIDGFAGTSVKFAPVTATDGLGSIVGYEDLQSNSSGILKALKLADMVVIYTDTMIFLQQYMGDVNQPFAFSPRDIQKETGLFYRNTLALAQTASETFHIYAGRNSFYRFDLTSQQPMLLPHFESCSDIFYSQATLDNTESIFSADNGLTHEMIFVFPSTIPDKMLAWDYKQDTISTSEVVITAAKTVRKPLAGRASGAEEDWCLLGMPNGAVLVYGLASIPQPQWNNAKAIFYRRQAAPFNQEGEEYESMLRSGMGSFGNDYSEKDVRALLLLMASQSPNTALTLTIYSRQNANGPTKTIGAKVFSNIVIENLMPFLARHYYFQSEIFIFGKNNPARWVGLVWNPGGIDSRSATRAGY